MRSGRRLRAWIVRGVVVLTSLQVVTAALAQTVSFSPAILSFSPAGPYSVPRDAGVGSIVASAMSDATAANA